VTLSSATPRDRRADDGDLRIEHLCGPAAMNWMETVPYEGTRPRDAGNFDRQHLFNRPSHRLEKTPSSSTIAADHRDNGACLAADCWNSLLFASVTAAPAGPKGRRVLVDRRSRMAASEII